jgi:hypothetical protein
MKNDTREPPETTRYSTEPVKPAAGLSLTVLSHEKLLRRNRAEVRRFVRVIRKILKRSHAGIEIEVSHIESQACCYRERWTQTYEKIMSELQHKFDSE